MKKRICIIAIIIFIVIAMIVSYFIIKSKNKENNDIKSDNNENSNTSVIYEEDASVEELKEEYKITGKDDLYEISTEKDGRKVVNVKTSINYKVAFSGMIKNSKPEFNEIEEIYQKNIVKNTGIWIDKKDREKITLFLNSCNDLNCKYIITDEGYLSIEENSNLTQYDTKIKQAINGNKQYVLSINSVYYMVDVVTGNIIDNPYNDLDEYQTYEYVKDENKNIIFISKNKEKVLENNEIFVSLMHLLDSIE